MSEAVDRARDETVNAVVVNANSEATLVRAGRIIAIKRQNITRLICVQPTDQIAAAHRISMTTLPVVNWIRAYSVN